MDTRCLLGGHLLPVRPTDKGANMDKKSANSVIVRGMKAEWFIDHFKDMKVYFGGHPKGIPSYDADYIGFYLEAPDSAITHIGLVDNIVRSDQEVVFELKAIVKLDKPVAVDHAIRKQEYWTLSELGISKLAFTFNSFSCMSEIEG